MTATEGGWILDRARSVLYDHVHGVHAEADDPTAGCLYPGCEESYWLLAIAAGPALHAIEELIA